MRLKPAEYVISLFGGVRKLARLIDRSPASVSKWTKSKKRRGCDGRVPGPAQSIILCVAREMKLDLNEMDLISGRNVRKKN